MDAHTTTRPSPDQPAEQGGIARWARREIIGTLFVALALFLPAGRLNWVAGWALVALYAVWIAVVALTLIPRYPSLVAERARPGKGSKSWDIAIMSVFGLTTLAKYVLAGLDLRFGWTGGFPLWLQVAGWVVAAVGYGTVTWSMTANAFFATTVRIQEERGHTVATGGPYRLVRHPGYVGTILFELGAPLLLGSWWALAVGGLAALLMLVRTALEDRTLLRELDGYADYATQTRYRLLPGIW